MGQALIMTLSRVLNPGATITAVTVQSGDSLTVPAYNPATRGLLGSIFSPGATAGVARIRSPRMHDNAQGLRLQRGAAIFEPLMPLEAWTPIYPADALTVEASGGGAETDMVGYLSWFEDLPGIAARLASWGDIAPRIRNLLGVEVDLTSGATAGTYGAAVALNANFDTLKASTDYAILGYETSVKVAAIAVIGPDTGNQRIGGPGIITPTDITREWFVRLSNEMGKPAIPIINSNNRGATTLLAADVAASTAVNVSLVMAELG